MRASDSRASFSASRGGTGALRADVLLLPVRARVPSARFSRHPFIQGGLLHPPGFLSMYRCELGAYFDKSDVPTMPSRKQRLENSLEIQKTITYTGV